MIARVLLDTNVFISALLNADSAPRMVLQLCFEESIKPVMGHTLYAEYTTVCQRHALFENSPLNSRERQMLLDDFMSLCDWMSIYYLWRPNLPDEGDNHIIELAMAGHASHIITGNTKDFHKGELHFPEIAIMTPREYINATQRN